MPHRTAAPVNAPAETFEQLLARRIRHAIHARRLEAADQIAADVTAAVVADAARARDEVIS